MAVPKGVGLALGCALALTMSVFVFYIARLEADQGLLLIIAIPVALLMGVPQFIGILVLSVVYLRQRAPLRAWLLMWGPVLVATAGIAAADEFERYRQHKIEAAHPDIREAHINLSGRPLWLPPERVPGELVELPDKPPGAHKQVTRHGNKMRDAAPMTGYDGPYIAASLRDMVVFHDDPAAGAPVTVPASLVSAYPDTAVLLSMLDYRETDRGFIYLYFHYPDRVEVAPALNLSGSAMLQLEGRDLPLVYFRPVNLGSKPIVRLEIDGQAMDLKDGVALDSREDACTHPNKSLGINRLLAPLNVRWQFAEVNAPWHQKTVALPAFKGDRASVPGAWALTSIELYFQSDGSVVAERSEEIRSTADSLVLRTTGPSMPLKTPPSCGTARDRYAAKVRIVSD